VSGNAAITPARADAWSGAGDYFLCGWRVRSAVPLPEAIPWTGDNRSPDVTFRFGSAPALLDPVGKAGLVQVGRDGACHLEIQNTGRFLVADGRDVIIEPGGHLDTPEARAWLLGPVLGILCHQRGLFPLHAACVRIGDGAIALSGRTGTGKSTLAAALVHRGHALVADDVCVIEPAAPDGPRVRPSFPRLKLWHDALQALDISSDEVARSGQRKYHFCQPGSFDPSPIALRAIYLLDRTAAPDPNDIQSQSGTDAVTILSKEIYRRPIGFHLGHKVALLADALRVASVVPVFRMPVRSDLSQLDAIAARVETHFASLKKRNSEKNGC
jgi:HPr Serine kinase C-terminal domain